jgi:hypothetical protein
MTMTKVDLIKITVGLSRSWSGFLRDWDRHLRAGNYPQTNPVQLSVGRGPARPLPGRALPRS